MSGDDFYDSVRAPTFADNLEDADDNMEDTGFFPETEPVEEIVSGVENMMLASNENAEDLSRLAMFGKKPLVKRRSQLRREQEAAAKVDSASATVNSQPISLPSNPIRRSRSSSVRATSVVRAPSVIRASSLTRDGPAIRTTGSGNLKPSEVSAPVSRANRPVTRSQTRAGIAASPAIPSQEHQPRSVYRTSSVTKTTPAARKTQPSPTPTQEQFNQAANQRAGSLGAGIRRTVGSSVSKPSDPQSRNRPTTARTSVTRTSVVSRPVTSVGTPVARSTAGRQLISHGAVSRPAIPRTTTVSRPVASQGTSVAPKSATGTARARGPVQVAPSPRPQMAFGSALRPAASKPVQTSTSKPVTRRSELQPINKTPRPMKNVDMQAVVDRLSKPKHMATPVRSQLPSTPSRIPNTYTHGIRTAVKPRSRPGSRPSSQASNVQDENVAAV